MLLVVLERRASLSAHSLTHQGKAFCLHCVWEIFHSPVSSIPAKRMYSYLNLYSFSDSLLRHTRAHDTASEEGDNSFEPTVPFLCTPAATDQKSAHSVSMESHIDQISHLETHNTAMTNLLRPNEHDPASDTQTSSFIPDESFHPVVDGALNFDHYSQAPTWLADEHFDLDALNSSVMESTFGLFSPAYTAIENSTDITLQVPLETTQSHKEDQVRQSWFTYVGIHSNGHVTPENTGENVELDEQYRQNLSQRLQQRVPTEPLPSTEFLVSC